MEEETNYVSTNGWLASSENTVDPSESERPVDPSEGDLGVDPSEGDLGVDPSEGDARVDPSEGDGGGFGDTSELYGDEDTREKSQSGGG